MAENTCGPSNALQSFQKHYSADRTLQQDKLIPRNSTLQGFRSLPDSNSGKVEEDFEAFQNASLPVDYAFLPQSMSQNTQNQRQPQISNWVSDFKELNFSDNPSQQIEYIPDNLRTQKHYNNWHQDFERQYISRKNNEILSTMYNEKFSNFQSRNKVYPMTSNMNGALNDHHNWLLPPQHSTGDIYNEEAFSRAFDLAAEFEKNAIQETSKNTIGGSQRTSISEPTLDQSLPLEDNIHLTQVAIGADTIENEIISEDTDQDALSKTASLLLNSVHGEQSKKFQNSQFLELMRQFRDKEATIQGDQVVSRILETQ